MRPNANLVANCPWISEFACTVTTAAEFGPLAIYGNSSLYLTEVIENASQGRPTISFVRPDRLSSAGFPANGVAIAANGGGDFLIIQPGSDDIEFWDHETGQTEPVEVDWD